MILIFPIGLALVVLGMWWLRRGSTLTRACRWREARSEGPRHWRCASCDMGMVLPEGQKAPRDCLSPRRMPGAGKAGPRSDGSE